MPGAIEVTYLNHSGFAVRISDMLLIFDNAQGKPSPGDSISNGHVTREFIDEHKRALCFVSHAHADHFDPAVYEYIHANSTVYYILGEDVPEQYSGCRMRPGDTLSLGGADIQAYGSTDEGVSFLVTLDGWTLFHAGDLNLWHWREQSTLKEIEQAERDYEAAVAPLIGKSIDVAFFPVDPRMGEMYDAGAVHFSMHIKPRVLIPMHWWGRADVALEFARKNRTRRVEVLPLTKPGQTARFEKGEEGEIILDG